MDVMYVGSALSGWDRMLIIAVESFSFEEGEAARTEMTGVCTLSVAGEASIGTSFGKPCCGIGVDMGQAAPP